jgi:DNA-binding transcriptional LysR family regulator
MFKQYRMDLRHLRYFLAVAEELNFTRAAARIGIGQPPLSQQIRALEQEVGATLFRRLPHGAELTEAGQALLPEARETLAQAERAMRSAKRGARGELGRLRLGFTSSAAFNPIVPESISAFRRAYPGVDLSLEETATTRLLERLVAEDLDAAFIRLGHVEPEDLHLRLLVDEPMVIVLPARHALAGSERLPLAALSREPFVLFPRQAGLSLFDGVIAACRAAGFDPILRQEAPQFTSAVNLVAAELGVSLVPASMMQVQVPGVVYRSIDGAAPIARLMLATRLHDSRIITRNFASIIAAEQRRGSD